VSNTSAVGPPPGKRPHASGAAMILTGRRAGTRPLFRQLGRVVTLPPDASGGSDGPGRDRDLSGSQASFLARDHVLGSRHVVPMIGGPGEGLSRPLLDAASHN
jgi:hypothetical protein